MFFLNLNQYQYQNYLNLNRLNVQLIKDKYNLQLENDQLRKEISEKNEKIQKMTLEQNKLNEQIITLKELTTLKNQNNIQQKHYSQYSSRQRSRLKTKIFDCIKHFNNELIDIGMY